MSVAIARLTDHFLSARESGAIPLEYSEKLAGIDESLPASLISLSLAARFVLGESPIVIQQPKIAPEIPQLFKEFTLQPFSFPEMPDVVILPQPQEISIHIRPLDPPPEPKRRRVGGDDDTSLDPTQPQVYWNTPDTLAMRRVRLPKLSQPKRQRHSLATVKIRTGNLHATQSSRSFHGNDTPERVTIDGTYLWQNVPYGHQPVHLPARAEFWNGFGSVWFELHLTLPEPFISQLVRSIDWPASNAITLLKPELVFCSHEQIIHRLAVGMNFRTGFVFGPNLQRAVQSSLNSMELVGSVNFRPSGIALALESSPFMMLFAGGKVIISNATLRVKDRPDLDYWHSMTITGLCHIGSIPSIPVWSPLPPDNGIVCFKTPSDRHWTITSLHELAGLAGGSTDWFSTIRRLPALFDHLLERKVCDISITADLPSGQITDISFSVFGNQVQYGDRQYIDFKNVVLTWSIFNPFHPAKRSWWQLFSATITLFGYDFEVIMRPPDLMVQGGLIHPPAEDDNGMPEDGENEDDNHDGNDPPAGSPYCMAAIRAILSGARDLALPILTAIPNSSIDALFLEVLISFDPFTDRLRLTGFTAAGRYHAWEF